MCIKRIFKIKKKKRFFILLILFLLIIFEFFYNHALNHRKNENIFRDYKLTKRHEWTLNSQLLQYSAVVFVDKKRVIVEGLIFLNLLYGEKIEKSNGIKCLILNDELELQASVSRKIIKIPLRNYPDTNMALWKIKCEFMRIKDRNENFDAYKVAIVNSNDFMSEENKNIFTNQLATIPSNLIKFQEAIIYYADKKKQPAIVNCVNLIKNLNAKDLKKLLNWLEIQFELGMKKVTLYFYEPDEQAYKTIRLKYSINEVEIINYESKTANVCKYENALNRKYPNSEIFQNLYKLCLKFYFDTFTFEAHEAMSANDCYIHNMYDYEYVTTLNFDEIIFPRVHQPNSILDVCIEQKATQKLNLYENTNKLFHKSSLKASCLFFSHLLFLNVDRAFFDSLKKANNREKYTIS